MARHRHGGDGGGPCDHEPVAAGHLHQTVGLSHNVTQAHDLFLDTALTIGVPGLLGLLVLLAGIIMLAIRGFTQDYLTRLISVGILASTVVYLVFGLTDQISFTIPTSFIIWPWACALAILVFRTEQPRSSSG